MVLDEYILKEIPSITAVAGSYSKLVMLEDPKNMYQALTLHNFEVIFPAVSFHMRSLFKWEQFVR
jgi:hypothetical protein